jgi:hypothetical protein
MGMTNSTAAPENFEENKWLRNLVDKHVYRIVPVSSEKIVFIKQLKNGDETSQW